MQEIYLTYKGNGPENTEAKYAYTRYSSNRKTKGPVKPIVTPGGRLLGHNVLNLVIDVV